MKRHRHEPDPSLCDVYTSRSSSFDTSSLYIVASSFLSRASQEREELRTDVQATEIAIISVHSCRLTSLSSEHGSSASSPENLSGNDIEEREIGRWAADSCQGEELDSGTTFNVTRPSVLDNAATSPRTAFRLASTANGVPLNFIGRMPKSYYDSVSWR
jgi:hypothetical protein